MGLQIQRIRLFIGILFSLVLALGCVPRPVYEIKYGYIAPESAEGKACNHECEDTRMQCEEAKDRAFEQERLDAHRAFEQCMLSQHSLRSPIRCDDPSQWIKLDYSSCLASYNHCFGRCGGKVEERNECVRNCG
jgi:hypothetical protein